MYVHNEEPPEWLSRDDAPGELVRATLVISPLGSETHVSAADCTVAEFTRRLTPMIDAQPGAYLKFSSWDRMCLRCERIHGIDDACDDDNR